MSGLASTSTHLSLPPNPIQSNTSTPIPTLRQSTNLQSLCTANASSQINNLAASNKPPGDEGAPKVKPCCVCKEEKAARDECMLFSTAKDPQAACADMVTKYRSCMKGFGFDLA
jgi:cytochrome c oxidase assembly protein subunit 17